MPRVLHITRSWLPQTETWIYNQLQNLPERYQNEAFCEVSENLDQFSIAELYCLRNESKPRYYAEKVMAKYNLRRGLPSAERCWQGAPTDIVHSHFGPKGWENAGWAKARGVPHVVTFYGFDVGAIPHDNPRWQGRYRQMFQEATLFLCEGPFMRQSIIDLGCDPAKVKVHHLGINPGQIEFRARVWSEGEPLRVLIAASFHEKKGIPYAIEALARLREDVPIEVTLIGDSNGTRNSAAEKARILETITREGMTDCVTMPGYVKYAELLRLAYDHHVFLQPSVTAPDGDCEGGCPVVLIEMMAGGMPIVATTHCDIPMLVENGVTGWLAAERDVEGLVQQLRLFIGSRDRWGEIAQRGRANIEREFDASHQGQKLGELYDSLLS